MMKLTAFCVVAASAAAVAWRGSEEEAAVHKSIVEGGMPLLNAFKAVPPKGLATILGIYGLVTKEGAFEYFTPQDVEVVFAAVSSINNCEMCLSFHGMTMTAHGLDQSDVDTIVGGGVPEDARLKMLVTAAKYSMAHNGVLFTREVAHLESLGMKGDGIFHELNYIVGIMSANNHMYVHMINSGLELEPMLHEAGPFKNTVYKEAIAAFKAEQAKKSEL